MTSNLLKFAGLFFILLSCNTGKLNIIGDIANSLKEVSAAEYMSSSNLIWVIEDAGNKNNLYGLNPNGNIIKDIDISNAENIDWEDLTSDSDGNIYIGDFGNNKGKRKTFTIYKVKNPANIVDKTTAEIITIEMPKKLKDEDYESFFLLNNYFYLFTKESGSFKVVKVANKIGKQKAELVTEFNLEGKHNKITSADISNDGKTVVLLNHDKLWKITGFNSDNFFKGTIEAQYFDHNSQKEGICFKDQNTVYISEERNGDLGSNIYSFKLH
ncbi:hypothetical protein EVU94_02130 [Flavobacteriaceae bacterium 144Ye]|nr:hypothetical protein EVU94_02130 [Flavobacteriaceae bacterium 144Ye]